MEGGGATDVICFLSSKKRSGTKVNQMKSGTFVRDVLLFDRWPPPALNSIKETRAKEERVAFLFFFLLAFKRYDMPYNF